MKSTTTNMSAIGDFKMQYPNGIFDVLLEQSKFALSRIPAFKGLVQRVDHFSQIEHWDNTSLSVEHRWTSADVGSRLVGFEKPDARGAGLVFEVELVAVTGPNTATFVPIEAFWLIRNEAGSFVSRDLDPFPKDAKIEIDGLSLLTEELSDRLWALSPNDVTHDQLRLLLAIQDWAFQPKPTFLM